MRTWPVYVEDWQLGCCGTPFGVGDRVAWYLALRSDLSGFEAVEVELENATVTRVHVSGAGREEVELHVGGVRAWWEGPSGARRGVLTEEHHDRLTAEVATEGIVRRIRTVRQRFVWSERHGAHAPSGDPIGLSDISHSDAMGRDAAVTGVIADLLVS
ncbi:MAG: DUF6578 domain-containing protein [Baekduiaceae bacterium]